MKNYLFSYCTASLILISNVALADYPRTFADLAKLTDKYKVIPADFKEEYLRFLDPANKDAPDYDVTHDLDKYVENGCGKESFEICINNEGPVLDLSKFASNPNKATDNPTPAGDKGPVGDKGPAGDKGPIGDQGPRGEQGLPGESFKDRELNKKRKAGTASAIATAGLLQSYKPGQSVFTAAAGQYQGQSSIAVGISHLSENGKYGIKLSITTNSQKEMGSSIGIGYFW